MNGKRPRAPAWPAEVWRHTGLALDAALPQRFLSLAKLLAGLALTWHLYVPLHELLHAAGCVATGGTVTELAMQARYGARPLSRVFPFVVPAPDGRYAGRLSGFETPNAWSHAVTVLLPYLPSVLGLSLLELARRRRSPWWFSPGVVLAYVPWLSVTGDFYELASLGLWPLARRLYPAWPAESWISDDLFRLLSELAGRAELTPGRLALVGLTFLAGLLAVLALTALQWRVARRLFPDLPART